MTEVKCEITGNKCIHSDAQPDEAIYENCRLCEVFEREYFKISKNVKCIKG